jgi:hypothetical protein
MEYDNLIDCATCKNIEYCGYGEYWCNKLKYVVYDFYTKEQRFRNCKYYKLKRD